MYMHSPHLLHINQEKMYEATKERETREKDKYVKAFKQSPGSFKRSDRIGTKWTGIQEAGKYE